MKASKLPALSKTESQKPVIGVFATCDPRIDKDSRKRAANIIKMAADIVASEVKMPDGTPVPVAYSDLLIDGEVQEKLDK